MTSASQLDPALTTRLNPRRMAVAIAIAVVLNLVVFGIGSAAGATWLANGQTIAWFLVVVATIIPMAIGGVLTGFLSRRWAKAMFVMAWVGLVFGVVTMPSPLLATENRPTGVALAAMHLITGVAWFIAVRPRHDSSSS